MTSAGPSAPVLGDEGEGVAATLDRYRVSPACFLCDPGGVHGLAHGARVLVWANAIGNSMRADGEGVDLEVVRWAAVLHDVRRVSDGVDPEHGARAATWIRQDGGPCFSALTSGRRQAVAHCCEWHVPADRDTPVMTAELRCLKDADALDRVRYGALDLAFLRTTHAVALVHLARALFAATRHSPAATAWAGVRGAARELGFWSDDASTGRLLAGVPRQRCWSC
jgi:hypothetical protein